MKKKHFIGKPLIGWPEKVDHYIRDTEILKEITIEDIASVNNIAALSFKGLGARGFARIDVKMDNDGVCYFMEANLIPGMNRGTSYFPRACGIANKMSYDDVVYGMLDESFERASDKKIEVVPDS